MARPNVAQEYNTLASDYEAFTVTTPIGRLETELYLTALGVPTGLTVLDLGGGTGLRARQAVERGAASVDVVDISAEMLDVGEKEAAEAGLDDRIRWLEADVAQDLGHVGLKESYDVVQANWVFDHAENIESLEWMLTNVATYLKPGGRFICVHVVNPRGPNLKGKKYGVSHTDLEEIPGGIKYWVTLWATDPPVKFSGASLEVLYSGSLEMYNKFGLVDVKVVPIGKTEIVREDPEFWKDCVEEPIIEFVTASKAKYYVGSRVGSKGFA
ncbi:putative toxa protein [Diaporthe ampelina]|uniref:Putative toxa protein n=1 Tax=Diaporthe ampelina TaxID=1214573 RepID=A0A0G2F575_9PEZI|nr:putative toxa protein [Diaporthe ampelina]